MDHAETGLTREFERQRGIPSGGRVEGGKLQRRVIWSTYVSFEITWKTSPTQRQKAHFLIVLQSSRDSGVFFRGKE